MDSAQLVDFARQYNDGEALPGQAASFRQWQINRQGVREFLSYKHLWTAPELLHLKALLGKLPSQPTALLLLRAEGRLDHERTLQVTYRRLLLITANQVQLGASQHARRP